MAEKVKRNSKASRQEPALLEVPRRLGGCDEVTLGLTSEQARVEALRCLNCKEPKCIESCPLHIDIKRFISYLAEGDAPGALKVISERSPFPGICGRVCQHELFCEKGCLLNKAKLKPVAIGALERYTADCGSGVSQNAFIIAKPSFDSPRVALIGSGPASLMCAYALAQRGYSCTVFEALHKLGGVLAYGIPAFRLPRRVISDEIEKLKEMGVEFETNVIVGKTCSLGDLKAWGYAAIFIGTGAGLPHLMGIPGENLVGVYTANEFLTRLNLMEAYRFPESDTPIRVGANTIVVGGGNSAMDSARWAKRMGSETTILFRRGRQEMRARAEEIDRAEEEGVRFEFLAAPVALIGDENGCVIKMECIRMRLGPVDESGRPSPVPIPGSECLIPAETVVAAIGQSPNPILQRAVPELGTSRGKITVDENGMTNIPMVFAGGDVARGGATVILALSDGLRAAEAIDKVLSGRPDAKSPDMPAEKEEKHE